MRFSFAVVLRYRSGPKETIRATARKGGLFVVASSGRAGEQTMRCASTHTSVHLPPAHRLIISDCHVAVFLFDKSKGKTLVYGYGP